MTKLAQMRTERGLSLPALARKSGVPVTTLHRAEHGQNELTASRLAKVARALGDTEAADAIDRWLSV